MKLLQYVMIISLFSFCFGYASEKDDSLTMSLTSMFDISEPIQVVYDAEGNSFELPQNPLLYIHRLLADAKVQYDKSVHDEDKVDIIAKVILDCKHFMSEYGDDADLKQQVKQAIQIFFNDELVDVTRLMNRFLPTDEFEDQDLQAVQEEYDRLPFDDQEVSEKLNDQDGMILSNLYDKFAAAQQNAFLGDISKHHVRDEQNQINDDMI